MSITRIHFALPLVLLLAIVPVVFAQQAGTHAIESCQYPFIKWKAKQVGGMPDVVAQLSTTYDPGGGMYGTGAVKYNLTLFKAQRAPYLKVELLDGNGFKLEDFSVSRTDFQPIPGTEIMEAKDNFYCKEADYRKARDYRIGIPGSSNVPRSTYSAYRTNGWQFR
jgi:hypothetical protein